MVTSSQPKLFEDMLDLFSMQEISAKNIYTSSAHPVNSSADEKLDSGHEELFYVLTAWLIWLILQMSELDLKHAPTTTTTTTTTQKQTNKQKSLLPKL